MGIVKIHTYQKRRNEAHPGFSCVFITQSWHLHRSALCCSGGDILKKRLRRLLLSERGDSSYISSFVSILQPPRLEVAFCMYPRMHLIFIYCCVIILTIRVTGTDMNKNSCKAAESTIYRTILRMAVAAGSLEKGQKGYGRKWILMTS